MIHETRLIVIHEFNDSPDASLGKNSTPLERHLLNYSTDNSANTFLRIFCPLSKFKTRNRSSIKCALSLAWPIGKLIALALNSCSNHLTPEIVPPYNKPHNHKYWRKCKINGREFWYILKQVGTTGQRRQGTSRMYKGSIPHSSLTARSRALNPRFSGSPSHQSAWCSTTTERVLSLWKELNFSCKVDLKVVIIWERVWSGTILIERIAFALCGMTLPWLEPEVAILWIVRDGRRHLAINVSGSRRLLLARSWVGVGPFLCDCFVEFFFDRREFTDIVVEAS